MKTNKYYSIKTRLVILFCSIPQLEIPHPSPPVDSNQGLSSPLGADLDQIRGVARTGVKRWSKSIASMGLVGIFTCIYHTFQP